MPFLADVEAVSDTQSAPYIAGEVISLPFAFVALNNNQVFVGSSEIPDPDDEPWRRNIIGFTGLPVNVVGNQVPVYTAGVFRAPGAGFNSTGEYVLGTNGQYVLLGGALPVGDQLVNLFYGRDTQTFQLRIDNTGVIK